MDETTDLDDDAWKEKHGSNLLKAPTGPGSLLESSAPENSASAWEAAHLEYAT